MGENNKNYKRLSVKEAAELLNMSEQALRVQMQYNVLPIGTYLRKNDCKRGYYYIYEDKIKAFLSKDN